MDIVEIIDKSFKKGYVFERLGLKLKVDSTQG